MSQEAAISWYHDGRSGEWEGVCQSVARQGCRAKRPWMGSRRLWQTPSRTPGRKSRTDEEKNDTSRSKIYSISFRLKQRAMAFTVL